MDIQDTRQLKTFSTQRLERNQAAEKIVLLFAALALGSSALVSLINYLISLQISKSGGLGNLGIRSVLSTVQTMLPLVQSLLVKILELGYLAAMLRVARGQFVSERTLKLGFDRFWPLLRLLLIEGLIYLALEFGCIYLAVMIYLMTPLSRPVIQLLMPLMQDTSMLSSGLVLDDALYDQLIAAMTPVFLICGLLFCVAAVPVIYQYRMAEYVLIDRPGLGAMAALRESRKMMRRNRLKLLRVDISLWWFYAAVLLANVIGYGDTILPMLGVSLPMSEDAAYYLFYALSLALLFAGYYFLRNRAEVTYALVYDALRPKEKQDGVVLGNIFQM